MYNVFCNYALSNCSLLCFNKIDFKLRKILNEFSFFVNIQSIKNKKFLYIKREAFILNAKCFKIKFAVRSCGKVLDLKFSWYEDQNLIFIFFFQKEMVEMVDSAFKRAQMSLGTYRDEWVPIMTRHIEEVKEICRQLVLQENDEQELTVAAQLVLKQYLDALNKALSDVSLF